MAGVNLNEESARILATNSELVGTQIRSCKDEAFLHPGLLHRRILETGKICLPSLFCSVTQTFPNIYLYSLSLREQKEVIKTAVIILSMYPHPPTLKTQFKAEYPGCGGDEITICCLLR